MDFHIDHEIRLSEESEYKSLYSWSLQEFSRDGKKIGPNQIPWRWSLYFTASEVRYSKSIRIKRSDESADEVEPNRPAEESESISAILHSGICTDGTSLERNTTFSMLGTDRRIESFSLRVYRLEDQGAKERCNVWGCVSYTSEIDFRAETEDDAVEIHIWLSPKKFDDLREIVRNQSPETVQVRLGGVSGFYSEWSPAVSTDRVKILASGKEQNVIIPEACGITPPRLGAVGEFELTVVRRARLNPKQDFRPVDIRRVFGEDSEKQEPAPKEEPVLEKSDQSGVMANQLVRAESVMRKLSTPLWIIVILLVVLLFK